MKAARMSTINNAVFYHGYINSPELVPFVLHSKAC